MKVEMEGIMKSGYGIVPKVVMRDRQLSIEAKAIYAYLASYTNAKGEAFPSVEQMCADLNISRHRLKKHRQDLEARGYVTIFRKRKEVGFTNNTYRLHLTVKERPIHDDHVYRLYKRHHLVPASPEMNGSLHRWLQKVGADIVSLAIERTANYSRQWNYTKSILEDWEQRGWTTIERVKEGLKRKIETNASYEPYVTRSNASCAATTYELQEESSQHPSSKEEINRLRKQLMEELGTAPSR